MYRIKRAKDVEGNKTGRIEVEKSEADHNDHKPVDNTEEERTYDIWDKEMDQLLSHVRVGLQVKDDRRLVTGVLLQSTYSFDAEKDHPSRPPAMMPLRNYKERML